MVLRKVIFVIPRVRSLRDGDFNYRMRTKFVQTLADCQLELKGLKTRYEFQKAKPSEEDDDEEEADDEFIDVTGDDSSTEVQRKIIPNLEQPPSKIYYDNIEKESSDGGFFDRDDLEDEDEKNDLIIDCKLNQGETGEKKTDSGICGNPKTPTAEPELVFNFTVVDTQLIYNEGGGSKSTNSSSLRCGVGDGPVVSITIPPPSRASPVQEKHSLLAAKLKEVRIHPYARIPPMLSNRPKRIDEYSSSLPTSSPVRRDGLHRIHQRSEPIGSRYRPSAFSPPAKAHVVPQSVHLQATMRPSTKLIPLSPTQLPPHQILRKPPKKLYCQLPQMQQLAPYPPFNQFDSKVQPSTDKNHQHPQRLLISPEVQKSPRYLPPQFGFGSSVLNNLYDPERPLDFSKNSLLCQYENMLKCPQQQQIRQGHSILRSMPLPTPPKPPKSACRPKVVPLKQHPTLYRIHHPRTHPANEPLSPSTKQLPVPPEPPLIVTESFRQHMHMEIEKFFTRRQSEICQALRLFANEAISLDDLFRRLEHFQVRFSRDYNGLAWTMVERYGYRMRRGAQPSQPTAYRFKEPPQSFAEYFRSLKDSLRPHAPQETLNIYRLVVGSLLEQFRDSLEDFLSRNLH
nr:uncharacterized protein LOC109399110 isoform X2 [Aedes albopictus]